jgi:hypothetical protein
MLLQKAKFRARLPSEDANQPPRAYHTIVYVDGGGIGLEAATPLQLALAIQRHSREDWNRDPGDIEANQRTAEAIMAGRVQWRVDDEGDAFPDRWDW